MPFPPFARQVRSPANPGSPATLKIEHLPIQHLRPHPNNTVFTPNADRQARPGGRQLRNFDHPAIIDDQNTVLAGAWQTRSCKKRRVTEHTLHTRQPLNRCSKSGPSYSSIIDWLKTLAGDFQLLAKEVEFLQSERSST